MILCQVGPFSWDRVKHEDNVARKGSEDNQSVKSVGGEKQAQSG